MIDHIFGRPSPSWKRFQVCSAIPHPVLLMCIPVLCRCSSWSCFGFGGFSTVIQTGHGYYGCGKPIDCFVCVIDVSKSNLPVPVLISTVCQCIERFTPWQLIVSTLTGVYAVRNLDKILGLGGEHIPIASFSPYWHLAHSTWTARPSCKFHLCTVSCGTTLSLCQIFSIPLHTTEQHGSRQDSMPALRQLWRYAQSGYEIHVLYYSPYTI